MSDFISQYQNIIFIVMALTVFVLAIYLGVLFNQMKKQKLAFERQKKKEAEAALKRELFILESIEIITKGVIQDQCEVSEGVLRIKNLKDQLEYMSMDMDFQVIDQMYNEIQSFDTLESRSELSKQERFNQDKKRFAIENEYKDRVVESCRDLLVYVKQNIQRLNDSGEATQPYKV
jgi:hypothetical protein